MVSYGFDEPLAFRLVVLQFGSQASLHTGSNFQSDIEVK